MFNVCCFSSSELMAHSAQAIGIVGCLSCVIPHVANNLFNGHLPILRGWTGGAGVRGWRVRNRGWRVRNRGWRGREAGVEGAGSGDRGGGEPGKIGAGN